MAGLVELPKLLDVQVQQLTWRLAFVAAYQYGGLQSRQSSHARRLAGARNDACGQPDALGNACVGQALVAAQRHGALDFGGVAATGAGVRARAAIV